MIQDEEWEDVLKWVKKWCRLNNCTKYGFMRHYSLPIKDIGFLYYEVPSTKPRSLYGYEFRMKVLNMSKTIEMTQMPSTDQVRRTTLSENIQITETIQDKINDLYKTNIQKWRWDIHLDIEGNNIYIRYDIAKPGCLETFLKFLFANIPNCSHLPIIRDYVK
jgi:hypothetical protein